MRQTTDHAAEKWVGIVQAILPNDIIIIGVQSD